MGKTRSLASGLRMPPSGAAVGRQKEVERWRTVVVEEGEVEPVVVMGGGRGCVELLDGEQADDEDGRWLEEKMEGTLRGMSVNGRDCGLGWSCSRSIWAIACDARECLSKALAKSRGEESRRLQPGPLVHAVDTDGDRRS